jgi:hypothetical protein
MSFSTKEEQGEIKNILLKYARLPFTEGTIPGAVMEAIIAHVRKSAVLKTYDFVDVVDRNGKLGWQVKSTKEATPVTWKRAKIENKEKLIQASKQNDKGRKALGDAIIAFCNKHAADSLRQYGLTHIYFARVVTCNDGTAFYYERQLCTDKKPVMFEPDDFTWQWSEPKKSGKKEQLPAFHGTHIQTQKKWWAWHGLGENQLHFSGEKYWWPAKGAPTRIDFSLPNETERFDLLRFIDLLSHA